MRFLRKSITWSALPLLEVFPQQFPDYWQAHHAVPPVVGVSFEARADRTASLAMARLYRVVFQASQD